MEIKQQTIDQCVALAGIAQSIRVVQNIAWKGQTNETDFKAVIIGLLKMEAPSAAAVYSGSFELSSGLRIVSQQLDPQHADKDPEFVNLAINVISLQLQLRKNAALMETLSQKIGQISSEYLECDLYQDDRSFERLLAACSEAYQQTLSRLPNRIQVKGNPNYLKDENNQIRVRAALFAAIRASFLWRQYGGSRWHFLFAKKQILAGVRRLIAQPVKD